MRVFYFWLVAGTVIALIIPATILSDWKIIKDFTDFMSTLVPAINRATKVSDMPEVTRFYISFMWVLFPVMVLTFLFYMENSMEFNYFITKINGFKFFFAATLGSCLMAALTYLLLWEGYIFFDDQSQIDYAAGYGKKKIAEYFFESINYSRLSIGIIFSIFFVSATIFIGHLLFSIRKIF